MTEEDSNKEKKAKRPSAREIVGSIFDKKKKAEEEIHKDSALFRPPDQIILPVDGEKPKTHPNSINAALRPVIRKPETFIPTPKARKPTPLSVIAAATKANSELLAKPVAVTASPLQAASALLKVHVKHAQTPQKANIFLDGKLVGQSDSNGMLTIPELKTDSAYLVKVESNGFAMWAKEIQLKKPGFNHLHVGLQSLAALQKRGARKATDLVQKGKVTVILANPNQVRYAFIYVNGKLWKESIAPAQLELPAGKYVLEAKRDGFRCDPPSRTIHVVGGESTSVRFYLNPAK
jgi:hypothetical protein